MTTLGEFFPTKKLLYTQINIRPRRICDVAEGDTSLTNQLGMQLDPIKIPIFDSDPANSLSFKHLFEALVHDRKDLVSNYKLSKLCQHINVDNVSLARGTIKATMGESDRSRKEGMVIHVC